MNSLFIMCINSGVMYLFTSFVTERVSLQLKRMEEEGQVSLLSIRTTEYIFLYCCAAFAVRGAGFYVITFRPLPAFCSMGGFWLTAMCTWIPLTTSFLFLAVMWKSGVSELRLADAALEITDEGCDIDVGIEDLPTVCAVHNPLSH